MEIENRLLLGCSINEAKVNHNNKKCENPPIKRKQFGHLSTNKIKMVTIIMVITC